MKNLSLLAIFIFAIYGCKSDALPAEVTTCSEYHDSDIGFIHTVYFWMQKGATEADHKRMKEGMEKLSKAPSISRVYYGPPSDTGFREVVDDSYAYAFIVHFNDKAAHDAYQTDSIHLAFIDAYQDLWTKVQVYDNEVLAIR